MNKTYLNIEVMDRKSFAEFVGLLLKDFRLNGNSWENNKLEFFLEAIQAYTDDLSGFYENNHPEIDADEPAWGTFADILKGAVIYE